MLRKGIDVSNWGGYLPVDKLEAIHHARGVDFAIVNSFSSLNAQQQINNLRAAGITVENLYCYIYFNSADSQRIANAIELAKRNGINFIWVDCEHEENIPGAEQITAFISAAIEQIEKAGLSAGIYTRGQWWQTYVDDTHLFESYPLWIASWILGRDIVANDFLEFGDKWPSFGGWEKVTIWQYAGTTNLDGISCDLNAMLTQEDMPTVPELSAEVEPEDTVVVTQQAESEVDTDGTPPVDSPQWFEGSKALAHSLMAGYLMYYKQIPVEQLHPDDRFNLHEFAAWVMYGGWV